jgi:hypothetical protein
MQDIRKGAVLIWSFLLCAGAVYAAPTAAPLDLTLIQTIADPEGDARLDYAAVDPAGGGEAWSRQKPRRGDFRRPSQGILNPLWP